MVGTEAGLLGYVVLYLLIAEPTRGKETERSTETEEGKRDQDDNTEVEETEI